MRKGLIAWTLVALVLLLAFGNSSAGASSEANDPAGDAQWYVGDQVAPAPPGYDALDITHMEMREESSETLLVSVQVVGQIGRSGSSSVHAYFSFGGASYRVTHQPCTPELPFTVSRLAGEPTDSTAWNRVACAGGAVDLPQRQWVAQVPKANITSAVGLPLLPGDVLKGIHAEGNASIGPGSWVADRAPDEGHLDDVAIVDADTDGSPIVIFAAQSVRFSNGEAASVSYSVYIRNLGEHATSTTLVAEELAGGWTLKMPSRVEIHANETRHVPIFLTTSSSHEHGKTHWFRIVATPADGAGSPQVQRLGIHWPAIPQPAGHHNVIELHSYWPDSNDLVPAGWDTWMNTVRNDPVASDVAVPPDIRVQPSQETRLNWSFPLRPALFMGLDARTEEIGVLSLRFESTTPLQIATVEAFLQYCEPLGAGPAECTDDLDVVLASAGPLEVSFGTDDEQEVMLPVEMQPPFDYVAFQPGANVRLVVSVSTPIRAVTGQTAPVIDPSSSRIQLPLDEYLDRVDDEALSVGGSLELDVLGNWSKKANAGNRAIFDVEIKNTGSQPLGVGYAIQGHNAAWAQWLPGTPTDIGSEESVLTHVVATIPREAAHGETMDVFVVVEDSSDPGSLAAKRLRVIVTEEISIPDEEPTVAFRDDSGRSPGVGAMSAMLAAGVAVTYAVHTRRRRE